MNKANNTRRTTLTLVLAAVIGGAGVFTTALASPLNARRSDAAAFQAGAAERKAAELPQAWRYEKAAVSFDDMYAR